jgi:hypothetical protein
MNMLDMVAAQLAAPPHWVTFKPHGSSMTPLIRSGQEVTVHRLDAPEALKAGDIVLARVHGVTYLHKILAVDRARKRVQIGNNHGRVNGWTPWRKVYGIYRTDAEWLAGSGFEVQS